MAIAVETVSDSEDHYGPGDTEKKTSNAFRIDTESVRTYVFNLIGRLKGRVSVDSIRPLPMFLGITGPGFCLSAEAFTPPSKSFDKSTPEKVRSRLRLNFAFFLSNYALVAFGVAVVVALMHPSMLFSVAWVCSLWWLHNFLISNELIVFGRNVGTLLSIQQRSNALFVITTIVIVFQCLVPTMFFITISALLILAHALMRDPKHTTSDLSSTHATDSDEDESQVLVERPLDRGDII